MSDAAQAIYGKAIRDALDTLYPPGSAVTDDPDDTERARRLQLARARLKTAMLDIRALARATS